MNELGIARFKANVQVGDTISVSTSEIGYDEEKLSYHGEVVEIRDKDFVICESGIEYIISYKKIYWHSAE
ncbi:hypothetical protein [Bacillus cereus group sp. BfR-BA-01347]|uniref:hypothetical protein n=1 Tax=Bacillus cereus group sp. BfR-BA-01347 TaxID=2920310 RepID=UPI001F59C5FF|nr:hypothetical protein [Bacillus cereus group sp. BfR-BA-01347]